jgi:hypothetical protein
MGYRHVTKHRKGWKPEAWYLLLHLGPRDTYADLGQNIKPTILARDIRSPACKKQSRTHSDMLSNTFTRTLVMG